MLMMMVMVTARVEVVKTLLIMDMHGVFGVIFLPITKCNRYTLTTNQASEMYKAHAKEKVLLLLV